MTSSSPHPVDLSVGKQLRELRHTNGFTQEFIGKTVGVSSQQIQKYEQGRNRISASRLYEFSMILDCEVADFYVNVNHFSGNVVHHVESVESGML